MDKPINEGHGEVSPLENDAIRTTAKQYQNFLKITS